MGRTNKEREVQVHRTLHRPSDGQIQSVFLSRSIKIPLRAGNRLRKLLQRKSGRPNLENQRKLLSEN